MITKFSILYVGQIELENVGRDGPGAHSARLPVLRDGVAQKAWLIGPPASIIESLKQWEVEYPGLDQVMLHWAEGMPREGFKEQLRWFAREVMPAFTGASAGERVPLSSR